MNFKRLRIFVNHRDEFIGSLEVESEKGEINLVLNEEQITQIVAICADSICDIAQDAADSMKTQVLESMKKVKAEVDE